MYTEKSMLPSDIYFSQATINSYFDSKSKHASFKIGETLDELCEGNITVRDIPKIRVVWKDGKYYTEDNRRLWVFKQLEKLGGCGEIKVLASDSYERMFRREEKFTTTNGGTDVTIRGPPGGSWYKKAQRLAPVNSRLRRNEPRNDDDVLTGVLVTVGIAAVWFLGKAIFGR